MTIRPVLVAILVAAALTFAACGDDDSPSSTQTAATSATPTAAIGSAGTPSRQPTNTFIYQTAAADDERVVAVIDSGFTADLAEISGAVVLHNRNRSEAAVVQYRVTPLYDGAEGTPVTQTVVLLPDEEMGDSFSATYPADAPGATAKITLLLPDARWYPFAATERLQATPAYNGRTEGTVTNPFDHETGPLRLTVIVRDEGGRLTEAKID